jgi:hypothetical protein
MVAKMKSLKSEYRVSILSLVELTGLKMASYMRWKRRLQDGEDPVKKSGAKKTKPIDLNELKKRIGSLSHGKKRSYGTGQLYRNHRHGISRREFNALVKEVRRDTNRKQSASLCRVIWRRPDLVWALDGLEYSKCHIQNIQDLCSRYKFTPLTTAYHPCGEEIAGHLSRHFTRFGPPLFIKRDNGGNLNHTSVNDLLQEMSVIPINSPCYTASYNGAIEHSQGELKTWLCKWIQNFKSKRELALQVENAAHALNHRPRRSLFGKNACRKYFSSPRLRYDKRKRKEVYDWIKNLAVDISLRSGKDKISLTAWRVSARKWMEKHRLIIIRRPEKVLPNFSLKNCHN